MLEIIKNAWIRTLVAFDIRDPLKPTGKIYTLPENFHQLIPEGKRRASICNLFANLSHSIDDIARHYEIPRGDVVRVLLEEGLVEDQRRTPDNPLKGGRRETDP